jgi:hypothetical protein
MHQKGNLFMRKPIALICVVLLLVSFSITAMAAGVDDGTLKVATKGGEKFFGVTVAENFVKYVAANGDGTTFYDLNDDKDMNVCDLVALSKGQVDFDQNNTYDSEDAKALRLLLIGEI